MVSFREAPSPKRAKSPAAPLDLDVTSKTDETDEVFEQQNQTIESSEIEPPQESEDKPNTTDDSADTEEVVESTNISVHKAGEQIDSWMCKTCNCIFLDQVRFFHQSLASLFTPNRTWL